MSVHVSPDCSHARLVVCLRLIYLDASQSTRERGQQTPAQADRVLPNEVEMTDHLTALAPLGLGDGGHIGITFTVLFEAGQPSTRTVHDHNKGDNTAMRSLLNID